MKRIIYLLVIVGATFTGCNPIEDIYKNIDAQDNPVVGSAEYILTADDYDALDLGFGNFSSVDDAKAALPAFISNLYPHWGAGSSVIIGYDLYIGNAEGVSDFTSSDVYQLTTADYATSGSDAFGFYPNVNPDDFIPNILDAAIVGSVDGDIILAKYDQYFNDPVVGLANVVSYNFAGSMEGWTTAEEFGSDDVWTSQTGYVQGNSYFGGQVANTEWLVSPSIDLTGESNLKFQITQELDFAGDASLLKILVSTDYSGDVLTATWNEITLANPATGTMASSEDYDFSAYDGQIINMAFRYESSDTDAARWRIASMAIKTLGVTGDANNKGDFYVYNGGWEQADAVYYLSKADYDSMGEGSGQPGRFNNFSSSVRADDYIPTFLSINGPFAFAQEEDELFVIYKYFSTSCFCTQTRGNLFTVINGEWTPHTSVISTTLQFGHDGNSWVPDNTIRYTLVGSDYSAIVAALSATYPDATASMDNFANFDRRTSGGSSEWTDSMVVEALNVVLDNLDPSAADDQKYVVTFNIFNGSSGTEDFAMIKSGGVWIRQ
ncbi:hypothetical protein MNBD_BACTEROID02-266 [hydrothermal vent metagenome]|uniref:Uncharacterized protein n=1 Tax=hydrothermal vent metagenome TaxID=652676 RepID=A0A3B0QMY8_9ZZZZ